MANNQRHIGSMKEWPLAYWLKNIPNQLDRSSNPLNFWLRMENNHNQQTIQFLWTTKDWPWNEDIQYQKGTSRKWDADPETKRQKVKQRKRSSSGSHCMNKREHLGSGEADRFHQVPAVESQVFWLIRKQLFCPLVNPKKDTTSGKQSLFFEACRAPIITNPHH